jgi:hypothetical protein
MLKKPFLKLIAGIENRDLNRVLTLVDAAAFSKVDSVDICDEPSIIKNVKARLENTSTKLFVSSLDWQKLLQSADLGADYLELGNYDHLYEVGQKVSAQQIISSVEELNARGSFKLSVTVPGYLSPNEQANLAQTLHEMGVSIIQTEGGVMSKASSAGAVGQIEKATLTLANTLELKTACPDACILAAGGLSPLTVPLAIAAGADGIGIGKAVSNLSSQIEMLAAIRSIKEAMNRFAQLVH